MPANMYFLYPPVIAAITCAVALMFWRGRRIGAVIVLFGVILSSFLTVAYLVATYFTGTGIDDSVLFHILHGLNADTIMRYWYFSGGIPVFIVVMTIWGRWVLSYRVSAPVKQLGVRRYLQFSLNTTCLILCFFSVFAHPALHESYPLVSRYYNPSFNYLKDELKAVNIHASGKTKSFIYLYAESFELSFFDNKKFPGLLPNLSVLKEQSVSFEGIGQAPMTEWTIAGMTASQCGVPLSTFKAGRNSAMMTMPSFLPGAHCLGDILSGEGYDLVYMGGADTTFAGKGRFYRDHGFRAVFGASELDNLAGRELAKSSWGVYDDDLLTLGYDKFEKLASTGKRFGLVLLTLDTHSPHGHNTPSCRGLQYADGSSKMLNSVHCADRLIGKFIRKTMRSMYFNDVVLIVGSDHLMMRNDTGLASGDFNRENLLMIFNSEVKPSVYRRQSSTLDVAPTVMSLIGFDVDEFALGRNLLAPGPTLVEKYGRENFNRQLITWRSAFWEMWDDE